MKGYSAMVASPLPRIMVFFVLALCAPVASFTLEPHKKEAVDRMVDLMLVSSFDRCFAIADSMEQSNPRDPVAPLMKLFGIGLRDLDFDITVDSALFEATFARVMELNVSWEKEHGRSSYSLTLLGFAKATYSAYHLRRKKYVQAVQTGFDGLDNLELAKKKDPSNYDADYFLGLYDYARNDLKKRLWWVLFWFPSDRERGIRRLEGAAARAQFAPLAAKLSLIDIYFQAGRNAQAQSVLDAMDARFPGSRFVLWARVKADEGAKNHRGAARWYGRLKESYAAVSAGRHNRLVTGYKQAQMLQMAGDRPGAAAVCADLEAVCCGARVPDIDGLCRDIRNLHERVR